MPKMCKLHSAVELITDLTTLIGLSPGSNVGFCRSHTAESADSHREEQVVLWKLKDSLMTAYYMLRSLRYLLVVTS